MIFIKRLLCVFLLCFLFLSFFCISASADETSNVTNNSIFDNPIGPGVLSNLDNYLYIKSPFDKDNPNVYFNLGSGLYELGYIDTSEYPYWVCLFDPRGDNFYLLLSEAPMIARKPGTTNQYQLIEPTGYDLDRKLLQFKYEKNLYSANTSSCRVEIPAGSFRQLGNIDAFVYSRDSFDTVDNFRSSSHDIRYAGTGYEINYDYIDSGMYPLIYPKTAYNPVIYKPSELTSITDPDKFQDNLGAMIEDILNGLNFLDDFFKPLTDFFSEFWDEHVVGYLQIFIDNLTYYFKKFAIPDISFFENNFNDLYYGLSMKFPILSDISDMYAVVRLSFENVDNSPDISFSYQGVTYNLLDLSLFDSVMPWVHSIILVFAYWRFLSGLYKKLPNYI